MKDIELFNDHFQNYKTYGIPKAQLIIADIPYNVSAMCSLGIKSTALSNYKNVN